MFVVYDHVFSEERDYNRYLALFDGETESYRHVRAVFSGKENTGKTTVCRRLQGKKVNLKLRKPTVGAALHPVWFGIDWKSKSWQPNNQSPSEVVVARMGAMITNTTPNMPTGNRDRELDKLSEPQDTKSQDMSAVRNRDKQITEEANAVSRAVYIVPSDMVFLSLWDMGGHASFQASHNIFISSHGVYLLVFRLTDFIKDKLETDRLKNWVRLIGTFSSSELNAEKLSTHAPPIIFVGTFLDKLKKKRKRKDYKKQVDDIRLSVCRFPELSAFNFIKFCTLDNSLGAHHEELEILRGFVTEAAEHQDQWGRKVPSQWLKLEKDLLEARENGKRILKLSQVIEMNKSFATTSLSDENEIKLALEYLHCTRSVVYFREFDHVIIDPQWLADFFSIFITDEQFLPKADLKVTQDVELYKTKGELTQKLIEYLLSLEKNKDFLPYVDVLLALMEKFGLIVKILVSSPATDTQHFSEMYTIPSKLMELQQEDIKEINEEIKQLRQKKRAVSSTLCFVFKDEYVPDELFHRMFAQILRKYKSISLSKRMKTDINDTTSLYRGFGCFEVDDLCRFILSMHAVRSTIAVTMFSQTESRLQADSGRGLRISIEQILCDILSMSNQRHFLYTHQLHCNYHLSPYDTPVDLHGVIHSERGVFCKGEECQQRRHQMSKMDAEYWGLTEDPRPIQRNDNVEAVSETIYDRRMVRVDTMENNDDIPNRRPTPRELGRLSRLVDAAECDCLFAALGLPYPDVKNTKWESRSEAGITLITKMFLRWTIAYPNQTFRDIKQAMEAANMATDGISRMLVDFVDNQQIRDVVPIEVWSRAPTAAEIEQIVDRIGNAYFNLFLELGLIPTIIEQYDISHKGDFKTRICALLRYWIDTFQTEATIGRLLTAMKFCHMEWYSTSKIVSTAHEIRRERRSKCTIL
ncbi:uncharacterized protein LOC132559445 [Ylistrum balloti]|uniref:uncharacterized protein LOC132559445 n=1 Tax=Ylistrum balloti TaxID=509963 RepID=UPI0029058C28|nr:uncharacterized protein LOC132559445 [Ylistrum balloti]